MKKILSTLSAAAMLVAAVALVGCSGAVQANPNDILEELEAPSVTAKAYPGFIRLTWNKVNGASGYKVYRDGVVLNNGNAITNSCEYFDVAGTNNNLINGISYTYDVVALPGDNYAYAQDQAINASTNDSARAVFVKQAKTTVTETANVPSVADFDEQYKDYFAKFTEEDTKLKTELVTVNGTSYIKVTAPTLPEFTYAVYTYVDNTPEYLIKSQVAGVSAFRTASEDKTEFFSPTRGSGSYNVVVKVHPLSSLYAIKEFKGTKAEVKALDVTSHTSGKSAAYKDSKTVRIQWNPAKGAAGDYAVADYSVFRNYDSKWTKVAGDVAVLNAGDVNGTTVITSKTYYIDDTVDEGTKPTSYFIVLSKDGLYEDFNGAVTATYANTYSTSSISLTTGWIDAKTARIYWTPATNGDGVKNPTTAYTLYRSTNGKLEKLGEVKSTTITNNGTGTPSVVYYVVDTVADNTVTQTYKLYVTENGQANNITVSNNTLSAYSATPAASQATINNVQILAKDKDTKPNDAYITFTLGNATDTFKLYYAKKGDTANVLDLDYKEITGAQYYTNATDPTNFAVWLADLADGTYRFKIVESAAGKKDYTTIYGTDKTVAVADASVSGFTVNFGYTVSTVNGQTYVSSFTVGDNFNSTTTNTGVYKYEYSIVTRETSNVNNKTTYTDGAWTAITLTNTPAVQAGPVYSLAGTVAITGANKQVIVRKTNLQTGAVVYNATGFSAQ